MSLPYHLGRADPDDEELFGTEIHTEIRIRAPVADVWSALVDVDGYGRWNPSLVVDGDLEPGAGITVRTRTPEDRSLRFRAEVLDVDPERRIRWRGRLAVPKLLEGTREILLERRADDRTKVVHRERFEGLLVPVFERWGYNDTRLGFEAMNRALKEHVEDRGPAGG